MVLFQGKKYKKIRKFVDIYIGKGERFELLALYGPKYLRQSPPSPSAQGNVLMAWCNADSKE